MARGKAVTGPCCICGAHGTLTFEHVPPRSAFNDRPVLLANFEAMIDSVPGEKPGQYRIQQQGAGNYTLCARCNNNTGAWYTKSYTWWCYQAMDLLLKTKGAATSLAYPYHISPLAVIKQVMAMFCSVNGPGLTERYSELRQFLLSKDRMYLNPTFAVYAYLNCEGRARRQTGISSTLTLGVPNRIRVLSEISSPPFGYVLALEGGPPDQRLTDISFFARYAYQDFRSVYLSLPVLATHLWLPGDYRTLQQIEADHKGNEQFRQANLDPL